MAIKELSQVELWLLTRCIEYEVPLVRAITCEDNLRAQWGDYTTDMSGWSRSVILDSLLSLLSRGHIELFSSDSGVSYPWNEVQKAAGGALDTTAVFEVVRRQRLAYRFTKGGADFFEAWLQPDWDLFHTALRRDCYDNGEERCLFLCGSERLAYSLIGAYATNPGIDTEFGCRDLRLGVALDRMVTYWKVLPVCAFVRMRFRQDSPKSQEWAIRNRDKLLSYRDSEARIEILQSWEQKLFRKGITL